MHICLYYFLILCFYFHLLFLTPLATTHIFQLTVFDSISFGPACNMGIIHSLQQKKNCHINFNLTKCSNIMVVKSMIFSLSLSTCFLCSFWSDNRSNIVFFSYHILINILSINYYKFVTYLFTILYTESYHKLQTTFQNKN